MRRREVMILALIVGLIAARAVLLFIVLSGVPADPGGHYVASDAIRYTEIAETPGTPYRDFEVEIPPAELLVLDAVASPDARETAVRNAWLQFLFDVAVAGGLVLGWGTGAALAYLIIGLPLAPFLYFRLDLLSVALATLSMALARRRKLPGAGLALAAGFLSKFWPAVLVTTFIARRRWKALVWAAAATLIASILWIAVGGLSGPMQVASFRGATGWQLESTAGSVLLATTDEPVVFEAGANRIGTLTTGSRVAGQVPLIGFLALITWAAWRKQDQDTDALASLAAVGLLLALAPILSWQYISWLLPWMAIVVIERRWITGAISLVVIGLTAALVFQGVPLTARDGFAVSLLLARNAALIALVASAIVALVRRRSQEPVGDSST